MSLLELRDRIHSREAVLGVVGLGYVGLPLACVFADAGFKCIGVDIQQERVDSINAGRSPIEGEEPGLDELLSKVLRAGGLHAATSYSALSSADVIFIAVETPVDDQHLPDYSALTSVCRMLGPMLKAGALVIVESTLSPGTTDNLVRQELEAASMKQCGVDFFLGTCPERVMPGKLLANLRTMNRVCGGTTPETADAMVELYATVVDADLDPSDALTAELVKTTENAYRDVQIAFANEIALICEATGGDVWRVRDLVNKSPFRSMHLPGAGVGGHCIPKDPWLLASSVQGKDVPLRVIPVARAVNDRMPNHMLELLQSALQEAGRSLRSARILILGYAYLEDSDDVRNSPSAVFIQHLQSAGATAVVHDPYITEYSGNIFTKAQDTDAVVIFVRHKHYLDLDLVRLKRVLQSPILIDGRNIIDPADAMASGFIFRSLGRVIHE